MRKRTVVPSDSTIEISETQESAENHYEKLPTLGHASVIQLGIGVDLLGSRTSLNCKTGNILELTAVGVRARSKKTGRCILIPWANIRAAELI